MLKSSYLCTRFPKGSNREIDLLKFRYGLLRTPLSFFFCLPFAKRDDEKKKNEKKLRKYLEYILKSSYLCIRFLKRKSSFEKEAIFEKFT